MSTRMLITAGQFSTRVDRERRHDLIEGEVWSMAPARAKHGVVAGKLARAIGTSVENHRDGGSVLAGFRCALDSIWVQ